MRERFAVFLIVVCLAPLTVSADKICQPGECKAWGPCVQPTQAFIPMQSRVCCTTTGTWIDQRECFGPPWGSWDTWEWGFGPKWWSATYEDGVTDMNATSADVYVAPRRFSLGNIGVAPILWLGAGRASFNIRDDFARFYEGDATLIDAGGELRLHPCRGCKSLITADYEYQTATDSDRYAPGGVPGNVELDYTSHRLGVRYGYQLTERVTPSIGGRWISATASTAFVEHDIRERKVDLDRQEIVGGVDVRLARSLHGRLDLGYDGDELQPAISFTVRFGRERHPPLIPIDDGSRGTLTNPLVANDCASLQQQLEQLPDEPQKQVDIGCRLYHAATGPVCLGGCWPGTKCELRMGTISGQFYIFCQCLTDDPRGPLTGPWDLER